MKNKPTIIAKTQHDRVYHYYDYPFGYAIRRCTWTFPLYEPIMTLNDKVTCKRCPITKPLVTIKD